MIVTKSEQIRPFDVDGCLIGEYVKGKTKRYVDVMDPVTKRYIRASVNPAMVRLLKEEHHRGGHIKVWSRSGWEWARNVVIALGLETKVHEVLSKPLVYFDNEPVKNWLRDRVFIDFDTSYKGEK